jgi:Fe2+ or Zn2+ uptake regulation protein
LAALSGRNPRFASVLNRAKNYVTSQLRRPEAKRDTVLQIIDRAQTLLTAAEISEDSNMHGSAPLDNQSVQSTLEELVKEGVLIELDRHGRLPSERHQGGPWVRHYRRPRIRPQENGRTPRA